MHEGIVESTMEEHLKNCIFKSPNESGTKGKSFNKKIISQFNLCTKSFANRETANFRCHYSKNGLEIASKQTNKIINVDQSANNSYSHKIKCYPLSEFLQTSLIIVNVLK